MNPATDENDPFKLHTPRWLNSIVATAAELVLLVVTVAIITAMWLPAYLNSKGHAQAPVDHNRDDMFGDVPKRAIATHQRFFQFSCVGSL